MVITEQELRNIVKRSLTRIINEEIKKGNEIDEGFVNNVKNVAKKYAIPAAIGLGLAGAAGVAGNDDYDVAQQEKEMNSDYDSNYGRTLDNGGYDTYQDFANAQNQ